MNQTKRAKTFARHVQGRKILTFKTRTMSPLGTHDTTIIPSTLLKQSGLESPFEPARTSTIERYVVSLGSQSQDCDAYLRYFTEKMLPVFDDVPAALQLSLLRAVAQASIQISAESAKLCLSAVYSAIKASISKDDGKSNINFSKVECLLHIFHSFASHDPNGVVRSVSGMFMPTSQPSDALSDEEQEKREDFLSRMSLLLQKNQVYSQQLNQTLKKLRDAIVKVTSASERAALSLKRDAIQIAIQVTENIKILVVALVKKEPVFFRKPYNVEKAAGSKRKANASVQGSAKRGASTTSMPSRSGSSRYQPPGRKAARGAVARYQPPSSKTQAAQAPQIQTRN